MSIASMVLGIISLFCGGLVRIIVSILALVFGIVTLATGKGKKGFSITGISCGGVALVWCILVLVVIIQLGFYY